MCIRLSFGSGLFCFFFLFFIHFHSFGLFRCVFHSLLLMVGVEFEKSFCEWGISSQLVYVFSYMYFNKMEFFVYERKIDENQLFYGKKSKKNTHLSSSFETETYSLVSYMVYGCLLNSHSIGIHVVLCYRWHLNIHRLFFLLFLSLALDLCRFGIILLRFQNSQFRHFLRKCDNRTKLNAMQYWPICSNIWMIQIFKKWREKSRVFISIDCSYHFRVRITIVCISFINNKWMNDERKKNV